MIRLEQLTALVAGRRRRGTDDAGATAVEYGLLVALIAAVIIGAVIALGPTVASTYDLPGLPG